MNRGGPTGEPGGGVTSERGRGVTSEQGGVSPVNAHKREKEEERQIGSSIDPDGSDADSREEIESSLKEATDYSESRGLHRSRARRRMREHLESHGEGSGEGAVSIEEDRVAEVPESYSAWEE